MAISTGFLIKHIRPIGDGYDWNYGNDLPICVTINHDTGAYHIRWGAVGCRVGTDGNGNVNHFVRLL